MSDATDDLDYAESGEQERFRRADKKLWEKQIARASTPSTSEPTKLDDILNNALWNDNHVKQAVKELILEIIGEDVPVGKRATTNRAQNSLRAELRRKVKEL